MLGPTSISAITTAMGKKKGKGQDLLPVGLFANLLECYTGITEIIGFESGTSLNFSGFPVILFPLRPVSLMHKKCQGHKIIIHGMSQSLNLKMFL